MNALPKLVDDIRDEVLDLLGQKFVAASSSLLNRRELLHRSDRKFVLPASRLPQFLDALSADYRVRRHGARAVLGYRTLYYDTPDFLFYAQRENRELPRYKVRRRTYLDSEETFLELKCRVERMRTIKHRIKLQQDSETIRPEGMAFLCRHWNGLPLQLEAQVSTEFDRITLVSPDIEERATIDLDVRFYANPQHPVAHRPSIVEVKQARDDSTTPIMRALKHLGASQSQSSKYVMALRTVGRR